MNQQSFILKWKNDGQELQKKVNRQTFRDLMEAIRAHFFEDNLIPTEFVQILSRVTCIEIDMDKNRDLDIPLVTYTVNGKSRNIQIPRKQKIIWIILSECCKL